MELLESQKRGENMKKIAKIILAGTFLATTFGFFGCNEKKSAASGERFSITAGNYGAGGSVGSPLYAIAQHDGIFDEYGVDVKLFQTDRNAYVEALTVGKFDMTFTSFIAQVASAAQGADLVIFGGSQSGGEAYYANKDVAEKYKNPDNWGDIKLSLLLNSTSELHLRTVFQRDKGIDIKNNIKYLDGEEAKLQAAVKGTVDATHISRTYFDTAENMGLVRLFYLNDLQPDYVCCRLTANGKKFCDEREAFVRYLKAEIKAYKIYKEDPLAVINALGKEKFDEDFVKRYVLDPKTNGGISFNPDPNFNGVSDVYDTMKRIKFVENGRNIEEFFDISVYADALKQVIAENPDEKIYKDMWAYFVSHNDRFPDFEKNYPKSL